MFSSYTVDFNVNIEGGRGGSVKLILKLIIILNIPTVNHFYYINLLKEYKDNKSPTSV